MSLKKNILNLLLLFSLFLIVTYRVIAPDINIQPDSYRYVDMGLNLAEYGVLTDQAYSPDTPPTPALGMGGPFTAFEIALAANLNATTKDSLSCIARPANSTTCDVKIPALKAMYIVEIFVFHVAIWIIARLIFANQPIAWLAVAFSLGFKETKSYADSILTEPSYMMFIGIFLLLLVYAWQRRQQLTPWFWCGIALGLMALVKPAWNALLPAFAILLVALILSRRVSIISAVRAFAPFAIGVVLVAVPLFVRNVAQLDFWGLSDPVYLGASLAHRLAYNAMSWNEWAMGWLYYLPDFGDKAAFSLFGKDAVSRLDFSPQSYFVYGRGILHAEAIKATSPQEAGGYLIRHYFFNDPLKGIAVTALLFWRGIFVGNLMGLVGLLLSGPMLYIMKPSVRQQILFIALPLFAMAGVHALVSISLHRYNIPLIVPYSLIMAYAIHALGNRIMNRLPPRLRTKLSSWSQIS